eukprot:9791768-Ditylum_brightwellii.AAC.1
MASSKQIFKRKSNTSPSCFGGGHGTTFVAGYTRVSNDHDEDDDSPYDIEQQSNCHDDDDCNEQVSHNEGKNNS